MTDPSRTTAEPTESATDAFRQRQGRWRAGTSAASQPASRGLATSAALALTALTAIVLSTAIVVAPLFSWQTAAVALVVDDYAVGLLPTVPFAHEDTTALATSLSGRLAPSMSGSLLQLKGFDAVEAMRDRLHGFCVDLPLRGRDSMIAYVRGQCIVPPPLLDADGNERPDPLGGHACLVTTDASLRGIGLREMVPCRDVVESIGSAASLTTLVAMDLGNLRWDPRIGVLSSLVPRQLDHDFKAPPLRANGQNWLIASHDTLQYSGASVTARRTFFSAALEQGLAGAADQAPWGDGDRVVELHELAPFVVAWTSEWSRRSSGGRTVQRPAVWKLGSGRVAVRDIPKDVRLVRVRPSSGGGLAALRRLLPGSSPVQPSGPEAAAPTPAVPAPAAATSPAAPAVASPPPTAAVSDGKAAFAAAIAAAVPGSAASGAADPQGAAADATTAPQTPKPSEPAAAPPAAGDDKTAAAAQQPAVTAAPPATAPPAATAAGGQPPSAAPASPSTAAPPAAPPAATPAATPRLPASDDPWELLQRLTNRTGPPPESKPQPSVIDVAPHIWRQAASFVAAATTDVAMDGPRAERGRGALQRFKAAMAGIDSGSQASQMALAGSPPAEALAEARRTAREAGIPEAWAAIPRPVQAAIAARNDAVELGWSMLDVIGQISGGAGPQFIEPALIDEFIASIARLSAAIAQVAALPPTQRAAARADALNTHTQYMLSQISLMRSLGDQLLSGRVAEPSASARIPLEDRLILLRSRLPDPAQRAKLLPFAPPPSGEPGADGGKATAPGPILEAVGRLPMPSGPPRGIDPAGWKNCAALATTVVDLVEAAGVTAPTGQTGRPALLQPSLDDVASARRAIAALNNAAGDESAAAAAAAKLASRMTKLFERAAIAAALPKDGTATSTDAVDPDRLGGLLRIIDSRDAALVGGRTVVGPTRLNTATRYGLRVERPDPTPPRLGIATDIEVSVTEAAGVPAGASLTVDFDPAQVAVRLPDGTSLGDGVSIPTRDLPWRGGLLTLQVFPLRRTTSGDSSTAASLTVTLTAADYAEQAQCSLPLPTQRSVLVAARGEPGSITGIAGEDGWVRATWAGQPARGTAVSEPHTSTLAFSSRPARVTTWQLGLDALAGEIRKVDVELYALPVPRSPDARERAWADAVAALLDDRFSGKPLARAAGVSLAKAGEVVPLVLKPDDGLQAGAKQDPAAGAAPKDAGVLELPAPPPSAGGPVGREVGPDLAVVVRDAAAPAGTRPMITRIALEARHPRDVLSAVARYDRRARTVTVSLAPISGAVASLPADGMRVTLREPDGEGAGGGATATGVRPVVPRKPVAVLSSAAPTDDVVASWNGPDQGTARLALDVDGYPRGFTFAVDCSAAADMQPQGPQHDWRQIRILAPQAGTTLLKAPAAAVPMRLAVDAPADTFLGGSGAGGSVGVVLRQIGGGLGDPGEERVVWTAAGDRQVAFTFEQAPAGASLAIRTAVDDWTITASGEGFANVDVSAEARLLIAGSQSPLTDSRMLVFDGQAPFVDAPPSLQATVGAPLIVPIQASDDSSDGYLIPPERRRPGVSGLKSVEWALDPEGTGTPKEWQPAVWLGGVNYEARIDSAKLPFGVRLPMLVRATDAVGLSDPPTRVWLEVGAVAASKLNSLTGKVTLSGRGEPDLPVVLSGPGGDRTARTRQGGVFRFDELEAGQYKVSVRAPVRNQIRAAEQTAVTVEAAPAAAASVTLELK
jgi:hypothetical protein